MEFYYYNTKTFASKWNKPLLLSEELPKPNKWYKCKDPNNVTFYYWPGPDKGDYKLGDVSYEKPIDYYEEVENNEEFAEDGFIDNGAYDEGQDDEEQKW
jgi:hypothetical protein